ncbi:hypothetical protein A2U01_0088738, partial [Trifolium medium]|nr:hypothetical protein [Trifolium medium]
CLVLKDENCSWIAVATSKVAIAPPFSGGQHSTLLWGTKRSGLSIFISGNKVAATESTFTTCLS